MPVDDNAVRIIGSKDVLQAVIAGKQAANENVRGLQMARPNIAVGTPITGRPPQLGRIEARTGLRMMPTFPRSPLSFRTAGFPQYGWKAGVSDGTFPARQSA